MGARLVSLALQPDWATLTPTARLVLIAMCHRARDTATPEQPARTYFAGQGYLAVQLWGEDTEGRRRIVRRAIQELVTNNAVELAAPARGRAQASYRVNPDNWPNRPPLDGKMSTCASTTSPPRPSPPPF